jgi:hypothetical protein
MVNNNLQSLTVDDVRTHIIQGTEVRYPKQLTKNISLVSNAITVAHNLKYQSKVGI